MNGFLTWVLEHLAILVCVLIGVIVKMHLTHDQEFKERIEREIRKLKGET